MPRPVAWLTLVMLAIPLLLVVAAHAEPASDPSPQAAEPEGESATEIAKKLQNPIADLISVPFQNNANFGYGTLKGTQDILNIQPVIPIQLNEEWNLITRTILPLTWQPQFGPGVGSAFGLGNITDRFSFRRITPSGASFFGSVRRSSSRTPPPAW